MTNQQEFLMEVTPLDMSRADLPALDALVERLRSVRLKVGRWLPNADALEAWSVDYSEVFKAATRLDSAVRELDAHLANVAVDDLDESRRESLTTQLLLNEVESCADAFEDAVLDNLGGAA